MCIFYLTGSRRVPLPDVLFPYLQLGAAALARLVQRGPLHFLRLLLGRHLRLSGLIFGGGGSLAYTTTHNTFNLLAEISLTTLLILLYFVLGGRG